MYTTTEKTHQRTYKALKGLATLLGPISHTPLMLSPSLYFRQDSLLPNYHPQRKRHCSRPSSMTFCFVELWGKARREAFYLPLIVNEDPTRTLSLVILLGEKQVWAKNSSRRTMLRREDGLSALIIRSLNKPHLMPFLSTHLPITRAKRITSVWESYLQPSW